MHHQADTIFRKIFSYERNAGKQDHLSRENQVEVIVKLPSGECGIQADTDWLQSTIHPPVLILKRKDLIMKKHVVEIVEKVVYKVECSDISKEYAEKFARTMYDTGQLEGTGELESVSFDVEEKEEK